SAEETEVANLREYLAQTLPQYMIPSFFIKLEKIPLTPNEKIDTKALTRYNETAIKPKGEITAPRTPAELLLAEIWADVLGMEVQQIGIDDNFFHLGGQSLKAVSLTAKIHKLFDVKIPQTEIFRTPYIRQLYKYITETEKEKYQAVKAVEKKEYYSLSAAQKRIYILQQMELENTVYNMPFVVQLEGELQKEKLQQTFKKMVQRHESIRTAFEMTDSKPVQKVLENVPFEIDNYRADETKSAEIIKRFVRPFNLAKAPLLRVGLLELTGTPTKRYILMVDIHHIVSDGLSMTVFTGDFMTLYNERRLPPLPIQYKDFSSWQNHYFSSRGMKEQQAWWQNRFEEEVPVLELPTDYPRPLMQSFEGGNLRFAIGSQQTAALKELAQKEETTLYMLVLALFNVLLSRLSGQEDINVGTPVAGRRHVDLELVIGMFVNTLVLRNHPQGNKTFDSYLREVKEDTLQAFDNQDYQFDQLVEQVTGINRNTGRNPLFDVMFSMQNTEISEINIPELTLKPYQRENVISKFDLTLTAVEGEELEFNFEYAAKLFKEETLLRFIDYFKRILSAVLLEPHRKLSSIEILSAQEKHRLTYEFNQTAARYPGHKTIHQLFKEQVEKTPDNISVVESVDTNHRRNPVQLTYKQLDEKAGNLATQLHRQGVSQNELVGILADRTVEIITGILAILKAGCGYVPLNPKAPAQRNKYMLDECAVNRLLTVAPLEDMAKNIDSRRTIICIEAHSTRLTTDSEKKSDEGSQNTQSPILNNQSSLSFPNNQSPIAKNSLSKIAYVIFTSGSTGKPKGVPIMHSNFSPLIHWGYRELGIGSDERALQNLSYYFDWSVWEIFITLTTGASLYMIPDELQMDPGACVEFIGKNKLTILHATPTQWQYLLPSRTDAQQRSYVKGRLQSLRYLFIGAEKLTLDLVERSIDAVDERCRIFNMYGPTEATIISAVLEIENNKLETYRNLSSVPIGKPTGNSLLLVLDKYQKPVPLKVEGELYIGGEGIARGYLNNPGLSAAHFIEDSRQEEASRQLAVGSWQEEKKERTNKEKKAKEPEKGEQTKQKVNSPTNKSFAELFQKRPPGGHTCRQPPVATLYRTGDRVRWLSDGTIEFLGRFDFQVKIRGFRIELGEIEAQLLTHEKVMETVVTARDDDAGETYLCAYYVASDKQEQETLPPELHEYLSQKLPGYMVPAYYVPIEAIPLNPNGKVDSNALEIYQKAAFNTQNQQTAPRNELEKKLAGIWTGVLALDGTQVGIDDDFFQAGGHSLKATILITKIQKELEVKVSLAQMFKTPTIRQLALYIKNAAAEKFVAIKPAPLKESYPLSSAQKRLYLLQQGDLNNTAYNMPTVLKIGNPKNMAELTKTFKRLVQRHDSFRTHFEIQKKEPRQKIHPQAELEIERYKVNTEEQATATIGNFIKPFDLTRAP
ncbi:MAG: amino acid adenylation domain-containing protein, partial [bacterium]|nr:amino acid adenylation domain-containing protein [bacterium]